MYIFVGKQIYVMIITFGEKFLQAMYETGKSANKKHRYQPQIIRKYIDVINLMKFQSTPFDLTRYKSLHYEKLVGDKEGLSSVRVNDQYRIEFEEKTVDDHTVATICNITDLSNHYR
jgi:proteic killer suppression protein